MMTQSEIRRALREAQAAATLVGKLLRTNLRRTKRVNLATSHDIKLELDIRSQRLITKHLEKHFPAIPVLGEEGIDLASTNSKARWVVDPIDGTVNFAYGIPHACVSIALQVRDENGNFGSVMGVVLDPFVGECWTAIRGQQSRLNGKVIRVSSRRKLGESVIALGFAKSRETLDATLPAFVALVHRVRKLRMMGSAALSLTYVADGRFDAYVESGVRLWDIAAGGLILECAGGSFDHQSIPGNHTFAVNAHNGLIGRQLSLSSVAGLKRKK